MDGEDKEYSKGQTVLIPQGVKHRIENKSSEKVVFIEVQTGSYFGEDDIVRIEDDYNRAEMSKPKAIVVSGYFNPLHKGHIELFKNAKKLGDELIVIVNNDLQRELKGSKQFMDEDERTLIIKQLSITDKVYLSIDKDPTVKMSLEKIHTNLGSKYDLYFANGGDQSNKSISEVKICKKLNIGLIDGLGDKIQSSSWLLKN